VKGPRSCRITSQSFHCHIVYRDVSVTKNYDLYPAKGQWRSVAGRPDRKSTAGRLHHFHLQAACLETGSSLVPMFISSIEVLFRMEINTTNRRGKKVCRLIHYLRLWGTCKAHKAAARWLKGRQQGLGFLAEIVSPFPTT